MAQHNPRGRDWFGRPLICALLFVPNASRYVLRAPRRNRERGVRRERANRDGYLWHWRLAFAQEHAAGWHSNATGSPSRRHQPQFPGAPWLSDRARRRCRADTGGARCLRPPCRAPVSTQRRADGPSWRKRRRRQRTRTCVPTFSSFKADLRRQTGSCRPGTPGRLAGAPPPVAPCTRPRSVKVTKQ